MSLPALVRFIESYSFDPQIYLVVQREDGGEEEIIHQRSQGRVWKFRSRGANLPWSSRDADGMLEAMAARRVDLGSLERELISMAMMYIVHAEQMRDDAIALFGPGSIQAAVQRFEEMSDELRDAIQRCVGPEDEPPTPDTPHRPRLRLLPPRDEPR